MQTIATKRKRLNTVAEDLLCALDYYDCPMTRDEAIPEHSSELRNRAEHLLVFRGYARRGVDGKLCITDEGCDYLSTPANEFSG